jgi:hypothetical protein
MEKVSWIELGKFMLSLRFALSRYIVSSYHIHSIRIHWSKMCVGSKELLEGT